MKTFAVDSSDLLERKDTCRPWIIMILIETALFAGLSVLFSYLTMHVDIVKWMEWPEMWAEESTNFNDYEVFAGFSFIIVLVSAIVLFKALPRGVRLTACFLSALAFFVLVIVATMWTDGVICNYHPGGAAWSAKFVENSAFQVALCGLAFALPLVIGGYVIYDTIKTHKPQYSVPVSIIFFHASFFSSFLMNMLCYVISFLTPY